MFEWSHIRDIVNYNYCMSTFVITCCNRSESFLTCRIPLGHLINIILTIWSLMFFSLKKIFFSLKSTPMEFIKFWLNWFSVNRNIMLDFPTPESPNSKTLNRKSLNLFYLIFYYSEFIIVCKVYILFQLRLVYHSYNNKNLN